jgi:hypothetical protein
LPGNHLPEIMDAEKNNIPDALERELERLLQRLDDESQALSKIINNAENKREEMEHGTKISVIPDTGKR